MASITTKGSGSKQRFEVRYKDATGRHRSKTFTTKTDAKGFLGDAIKAEQRRSTIGSHGVDLGPERETTTVIEWMDQWLSSYDMQADTRAKYRWAVQAHLRESDLASRRLTRLTTYHVEQLLGHVQSKSVRYTLYQALAMMLDSAKRARMVEGNVAREVPVSQPRRERKPRVLTGDELTALFAALPEPWSLMAKLQLWTGARPGEAIAWRVGDLALNDAGRDTIAVVRAAQRDGTIKSIKTDNEAGERVLPLSQELSAASRAYVATLRPDALLFPSATGTFVSRSNFTSRVWIKAVARAKLDDVQVPGQRVGSPKGSSCASGPALRARARTGTLSAEAAGRAEGSACEPRSLGPPTSPRVSPATTHAARRAGAHGRHRTRRGRPAQPRHVIASPGRPSCPFAGRSYTSPDDRRQLELAVGDRVRLGHNDSRLAQPPANRALGVHGWPSMCTCMVCPVMGSRS